MNILTAFSNVFDYVVIVWLLVWLLFRIYFYNHLVLADRESLSTSTARLKLNAKAHLYFYCVLTSVYFFVMLYALTR